MNILREVRRVNQKSMPIRIILLFTFLLLLIVSTYAWWAADLDVGFEGIQGDVTSWDVYYYVNEEEGEILDQTTVFEIDELYPGMPRRTDVVHILNMGEASTNINYELLSVKVFGREVLPQLQQNNKIQVSPDGKTTTIFSGDTDYPFNISYTYDKDKLIGKYVEGEDNTTSQATFKFNVNWSYEGDGTEDEKLARDALDTQFGKQAYEYYQDEGNDPKKAIEVKIKITSNMVHPSVDPDYREPES